MEPKILGKNSKTVCYKESLQRRFEDDSYATWYDNS